MRLEASSVSAPPPTVAARGLPAHEPVLISLSRLGSWSTSRDAWLVELDRWIEGMESSDLAARDPARPGAG